MARDADTTGKPRRKELPLEDRFAASKRRRANITTTTQPFKKQKQKGSSPASSRNTFLLDQRTAQSANAKAPSALQTIHDWAAVMRTAQTTVKEGRSRAGRKDKDSPPRHPDPWTLCPPSEAKARMPPDLVEQYELAGLDFHEPLPRGRFPHCQFELRSSKARKKTALTNPELNTALKRLKPVPKGTHEDDNVHRVVKTDQSIRRQSVLVLARIMQQMIAEGEYSRAARAFALLLRTRFQGRSINLRRPEYWSAGANVILERGRPLPPRVEMPEPIDTMRYRIKRRKVDGKSVSTMSFYESSDEEEEARQQSASSWETAGKHEAEYKRAPAIPEKLWGNVQDYFELLISRYPASQRDDPDQQNAADFYYDMYVIWIAHIEELRRTEELKAHEDHCQGDAGRHPDITEGQPPAGQGHWRPFDESNHELLAALFTLVTTTHERVTALAEHMDEVVGSLPFSDSHDLISLRAQVERWLADLCVPLPARTRFGVVNISDDDDYDEAVVWTKQRRRGDPDYDGSDSDSDAQKDRTEAEPTGDQDGVPKRLLRSLKAARATRAKHRKEARRLMFRSSYLARTSHLRVNSFQSEEDVYNTREEIDSEDTARNN